MDCPDADRILRHDAVNHYRSCSRCGVAILIPNSTTACGPCIQSLLAKARQQDTDEPIRTVKAPVSSVRQSSLDIIEWTAFDRHCMKGIKLD